MKDKKTVNLLCKVFILTQTKKTLKIFLVTNKIYPGIIYPIKKKEILKLFLTKNYIKQNRIKIIYISKCRVVEEREQN